MKRIEDILYIRKNQHHLDELINVQEIVPFVGAGMSSDIYPMWREFLEQFSLLAEERNNLYEFLNAGKYEEAASYICSISESQFIDTVKAVFSPARLVGKEISTSLKLLTQITDGMVLTTNIDEILENVWQQEGKKFEAIITPDCEDQFNQAIVSGLPILVKLHGTVKESSKYVLTKEQYDKYYGIESEDVVDFCNKFPRDLGRAMQSKTVLFLGCSLKNDRVLHILKQIAGWNKYIKHYALLNLSNDEEENIQMERRLGEYGIYPIWFPNNDYSYIAIILEALIAKKKIKK